MICGFIGGWVWEWVGPVVSKAGGVKAPVTVAATVAVADPVALEGAAIQQDLKVAMERDALLKQLKVIIDEKPPAPRRPAPPKPAQVKPVYDADICNALRESVKVTLRAISRGYNISVSAVQTKRLEIAEHCTK